MMDNESVRDSRNTSVILLGLLLAVAVVWGITGTVMAAKNSRALKASDDAATQYRQDAEQKMQDLQRQISEKDRALADAEVKFQNAEHGRQIALTEYRKHQDKLLMEKKSGTAGAKKETGAKAAPKGAPAKAGASKTAGKTVTHTAAHRTGTAHATVRRAVRPAPAPAGLAE